MDNICYDEDNCEHIVSEFYNNENENYDEGIAEYIEYSESVISDLYVCIKRSQLDEDKMKKLFRRINVHIGSIRIITLHYEENLFLANVLGRKIIENDDILKIPFIVFDLNKMDKYFGTKFPLCLMNKNDKITIHLIRPSDFDVGFCYKKYHIIKYYPTNCDIFYTNIFNFYKWRENNMEVNPDHEYHFETKFINECKLMMINFDEHEKIDGYYGYSLNIDQDLSNNQLKRIVMSFIDNEITWSMYNDEIMIEHFNNMCYYIVSFDFRELSKKNLKDVVVNKSEINGMKFNKDTKCKISFEFDNNIVTYDYVNITMFYTHSFKFTKKFKSIY